MMLLEVCLPSGLLLERQVEKVVAPGLHGSFCLLPRHVGAVAPLRPGILTYLTRDTEHYIALDEGLLTKKGQRVTVVTMRAIEGSSLEELADELSTMLNRQDEGERRTRSALAGLESHITRGLIGLGVPHE